MVLVAPNSLGSVGKKIDAKLYFIDRFEVTNREFNEFILSSGYMTSDSMAYLFHWQRVSDSGPHVRPGDEDFPVRYVSYFDAESYAKYYKKNIPTRDEWLRAAIAWDSSRNYPWGDKFRPFFCNSLRSGINRPSRVGTFESGKSIEFGCYDMIGNVSEWTETEVPYLVEKPNYIQGGSFRKGTSENESWTFDLTPKKEINGIDNTVDISTLSQLYPSADKSDRYDNLGFRCVRRDALTYIKDTITSRIASLPEEYRLEAIDELFLIHDSVFSVLHHFRFEMAVKRMLKLALSPNLLVLKDSNGENDCSSILLCCDDGTLDVFTPDGMKKWSHEVGVADTYRYLTTSGDAEVPSSIIINGVWRNLITVRDGRSGQEICSFGKEDEDVQAQHLMTVEDSKKSKGSLLVDWRRWHYDDTHLNVNYLMSQGITFGLASDGGFTLYCNNSVPYTYIDWQLLLSGGRQEIGYSEVRDIAKAFIKWPIILDSEGNAFLVILDSPLLKAPITWQSSLDHMLVVSEEWPSSNLTMYDLESGDENWSVDFSDGISKNAILKKPIIMDSGKKIMVVLEQEIVNPNDRVNPADKKEISDPVICMVDASDGSFDYQFKIDLGGDRLNEILPVTHSACSSFIGIADSSDLIYSKQEEGADWLLTRRSVRDLIVSVSEIVDLSKKIEYLTKDQLNSRLDWLNKEVSPDGVDYYIGNPAQLQALVDLQTSKPWLIAKTDSLETSLLFAGFEAGNFQKAFLLKGGYNRFASFSGSKDSDVDEYLLLWGSTEFLLCFDVQKKCLLWRKSVGEVSELINPVISDCNGHKNPMVFIASSYGDIRSLDLRTGDIKFHLKRPGASFTSLLPVSGGSDSNPELMVGIREEGVFLLDPLSAPTSRTEKDLVTTINEFENWKCRKENL